MSEFNILEIIRICEKNKDLLRPFFSDYGLDVVWDKDFNNNLSQVTVFISTKYKRGTKKQLAKIKKIFCARDVMFIEGDTKYCKKCWNICPNFWSIKLFDLYE
jgi:hypothetical protein